MGSLVTALPNNLARDSGPAGFLPVGRDLVSKSLTSFDKNSVTTPGTDHVCLVSAMMLVMSIA